MTVEELLNGNLLKTAEDAQGAGRIMAQAYAEEMEKLCTLFGVKTEEAQEEGKPAEEEAIKKAREAAQADDLDIEELKRILEG